MRDKLGRFVKGFYPETSKPFLKGHEHSKAMRKKISEIAQGKKASPETKIKMSITRKQLWKDPNFRKKQLEGLKESLPKTIFKKGNIPWHTGKTAEEDKRIPSGRNSSAWKGGISFEPYPLGWTKTFKEQIRYRDAYKCQLCGMPEIEAGRKLDVHHIDYDKDNIAPKNLITLCHSCHSKTNHNREYWQNFFNPRKHRKCINK